MINEVNWDGVKFRASSWGNLLSEPVSKADKEAGKLSMTCQKELLKIYTQVLYGRKKDITTKQMDKGILCEPDSIKLFSKVEGKIFFKNEQRLENDFFCGHPDIFEGESIGNATAIWDIKSSWSLDSYIPKLIEPLDRGYEAQLNAYFDLTGAQEGGIAYCLVDCPLSILETEKYHLLRIMDVISEESPEYIKAAEELERQLTFPDIDYRERVIKIKVQRDDELIQKMKQKVPLLRNWLKEFHKKHMGIYPKND